MGIFDSSSSSTAVNKAMDTRAAGTDEATIFSGNVGNKGIASGPLIDASRRSEFTSIDNRRIEVTDLGAIAAGAAATGKSLALAGEVTGKSLALAGEVTGKSLDTVRLTSEQAIGEVGRSLREALGFGSDVVGQLAAAQREALSAISSNLDTSLTFAEAAGESESQETAAKLIQALMLVGIAAAAAWAWRSA